MMLCAELCYMQPINFAAELNGQQRISFAADVLSAAN